MFTLTVTKTLSVSVTGKVSWLSILLRLLLKVLITGLLCGKCQNDNGVSVLLNKCKSCGTANVLLILALGTVTSINLTISHML